jgi:hypothetical protein
MRNGAYQLGMSFSIVSSNSSLADDIMPKYIISRISEWKEAEILF